MRGHVQTQLRQIEATVGRIKQTNHDLFTAHRGKNRNPQFDAAKFRPHGSMSFLRQAGLVTDQVGNDLEPTRNLVQEFQGQMHQFGQDTVQANADDNRALPRLDMYVAGPCRDGIGQQTVHQHTNLNRVFRGFGLQILERLVHGRRWRGHGKIG